MFSCGNGRCSSVLLKPLHRIQASSKKEEKKPAEKDNKESSKKQESKSTKSDAPSSSSASDPKKDEKKHGRKFTNSVLIFPSTFGKFTLCLWCNKLNPFFLCYFPIGKSPGKMLVVEQSKVQPGFNKPRLPFRRGGRFDKVLMMYHVISVEPF